MPSICLYFQVHQPYRLKKYSIFDIGSGQNYFTDHCSESNLNNLKVLNKVAEKCYLPANRIILNLLDRYPTFKVSFSFSGVVLKQFKEYRPDVLESFQALAERQGQVEILNETSHHSLSYLYSKDEFIRQIQLHQKIIRTLFGQKPPVFRNTELIYCNEIAKIAEDLGFDGILSEGADFILGWRSPNFVYQPQGLKRIRLLLKNYKLSDDIAFRFSSRDWSEYPLTADKFAAWINAVGGGQQVVNLFMDYETFGEHQWEDTGIFDFLRYLPEEILKYENCNFMTPSEVIKNHQSAAELDIHHLISWADIERDLSAWLGNEMQKRALQELYSLEDDIFGMQDDDLIEDWRRLQTSDHFYYMCTKWFADGDVHKYFNPYDSPYDAFITYMNVLQDLKIRIKKRKEVIV